MEVKLTLTKGTTKPIHVLVEKAYDKNGNQITNLSGYTAKLRAKRNITDTALVFEINGIINGMTIKFPFSGNELNTVPDNSVIYANVILENMDGTVTTVDEGVSNIIPILVLPKI